MRGGPAVAPNAACHPSATPLVVAAIALGLVLRLAFAFGYWVDKPLTHDETEYLRLAQNLAEGRGFTYGGSLPAGTSPQFGRAPLYPLFLAGILSASGPAIDATGAPRPVALAAIKVSQALLGALSIWLIVLLARRSAGQMAGIVAAWATAIYPPLVWIGSYVLSEALFIPLALGTAVVLGRAIDGASRVPAAPGRGGDFVILSAGLLAGSATLTRPLMLFFLVIVGIWLAWRLRVRWLLLLALGAAVVVAPWTLRNYETTGHIVLVASEGGVTFWTGNNPLARGEGDLAANPDIKRAEIALRQRYPGSSAEQLEPVYYREAFGFIRHEPAAWLWLIVRKAFYTWAPVGPSYRLHSARYFWASVVSYLALLSLAVPGFLLLRRSPNRPVVLGMLAVSSLVACLVFFPQERFRIPLIDPALLVCAAAWIGSRAAVGRLPGARHRLQD